MKYEGNNQLQAVSESSIEETFEYFRLSAEQIGFEFCSIWVFSAGGASSSPLLAKNSLPQCWNEFFQRKYTWQDCPVIDYCYRSLLPAHWNKYLFDSAPGLWEDICLFGLQHGVSQSVHDHRGLTSIFSFIQKESILAPEVIYERMGLMLCLIHKVHSSLSEQLLATTVRSPQMSQRELDVLKWTAEGKTSYEIAVILSISERTVNFHVQSIIHKLEAKNKTAAVIMAIKRGLI